MYDGREEKSRKLASLVRRIDKTGFMVPSLTREKRAHLVKCTFTCTCEDMLYNKPVGGCKHIRAVRRALQEGI